MGSCLKSMVNEKDLISLICKVVSVLKCHGFNLKKFISNLETILRSLPQSTVNQKYVNLEFSLPTSEQALGLIWNIQMDHKVLPQYKRWNPQSKVINIRPARHTYTMSPST